MAPRSGLLEVSVRATATPPRARPHGRAPSRRASGRQSRPRNGRDTRSARRPARPRRPARRRAYSASLKPSGSRGMSLRPKPRGSISTHWNRSAQRVDVARPPPHRAVPAGPGEEHERDAAARHLVVNAQAIAADVRHRASLGLDVPPCLVLIATSPPATPLSSGRPATAAPRGVRVIDCDVHIEIRDREFLRTSRRASATGSARWARCSARRRTCGRIRARGSATSSRSSRSARSASHGRASSSARCSTTGRGRRRSSPATSASTSSLMRVGLPRRRLRPRAQRLAARGVVPGRRALPRLDRRARAGPARGGRARSSAARRPALPAGRAHRRLASGRTATRATCRSSRPAHELRPGVRRALRRRGPRARGAAGRAPGCRRSTSSGTPSARPARSWPTSSRCVCHGTLRARCRGCACVLHGGRPRLAARHPVAARHQLARPARARSRGCDRAAERDGARRTCASRRSRWSTRTATTTCWCQMLAAAGAPDILLYASATTRTGTSTTRDHARRAPAGGLARTRSCTTTPPRSTAPGSRCPRRRRTARIATIAAPACNAAGGGGTSRSG